MLFGAIVMGAMEVDGEQIKGGEVAKPLSSPFEILQWQNRWAVP